jgi:signal transduction histidine kinase
MSEFVAGNLLLVAQEAMHNAAQHARPASVRVEIAVDPGGAWVRLAVRDDGVGFTLDPAAGTKAGHFGLPGMRERVERLGGSLRIETAPGQGTTVHVEVPLRPFDEEIA